MHKGIYSYPATSRIVHGTDFAHALARELALSGERRIYVLASGTLARDTDVIQRVRDALGEHCANCSMPRGNDASPAKPALA